MKKLQSISAFFPAFNDGGTIPSMVLSVLRTLPKVTSDYEVIVVNDGSSDYTADMLEELERVYPQVRIVTHPQNRGYGAALRSGFSNATKEWIFYTDGDGQYDPRELADLVNAVQEDTDIVNGYKIERHDPLHRVIIGRVYHHIVRLMFGDHLPGDGQKNAGCWLQVRRGAGAPLPPCIWEVPVLQLPPFGQDSRSACYLVAGFAAFCTHEGMKPA
jgi:glycosyltransferase involved in cell wall biosynthesis